MILSSSLAFKVRGLYWGHRQLLYIILYILWGGRGIDPFEPNLRKYATGRDDFVKHNMCRLFKKVEKGLYEYLTKRDYLFLIKFVYSFESQIRRCLFIINFHHTMQWIITAHLPWRFINNIIIWAYVIWTTSTN